MRLLLANYARLCRIMHNCAIASEKIPDNDIKSGKMNPKKAYQAARLVDYAHVGFETAAKEFG